MEQKVMGEQTAPTKIDISKKRIDGCTEEIAAAVRAHSEADLVDVGGVGGTLAVVGPDRCLALPLERPDAVDLFVAVAALAA